MTDLIHLETLWQFKYEQLEKEAQLFKKRFLKNKICGCKAIECQHYKKEEKKFIWKKYYQLVTEGTLVNALTMGDIILSSQESL